MVAVARAKAPAAVVAGGRPGHDAARPALPDRGHGGQRAALRPPGRPPADRPHPGQPPRAGGSDGGWLLARAGRARPRRLRRAVPVVRAGPGRAVVDLGPPAVRRRRALPRVRPPPDRAGDRARPPGRGAAGGAPPHARGAAGRAGRRPGDGRAGHPHPDRSGPLRRHRRDRSTPRGPSSSGRSIRPRATSIPPSTASTSGSSSSARRATARRSPRSRCAGSGSTAPPT